jgi:hypothetical protein
MFDQGKYRWAFLFFVINVVSIAPVFCKNPDRFDGKEKINSDGFKTKDFLCDVTNQSVEYLNNIGKKAFKKLYARSKLGEINCLVSPVKGHVLKVGHHVICLDGKKAIGIPIKKNESYEKIANKIYSACEIIPEKTLLGMLKNTSKADETIPMLIKKIFEKKNVKQGEAIPMLIKKNFQKKNVKQDQEENKQQESKQKDSMKNKEDKKNTGEKSNTGKLNNKNRFAPNITISKVEKNTIDIDGKEVECFTCTKKIANKSIKRRLVRTNQESVFGFMFKNKKNKWVYYVELFGGTKGDLITEAGWKAKCKKLINTHDARTSLNEQITWRTKGENHHKNDDKKNDYRKEIDDRLKQRNDYRKDMDDYIGNKNAYRNDTDDYFIQNPINGPDQDLFRQKRFDDIT